MRYLFFLLILSGICSLGLSSYAAIINVPADQPTIQAGINAAIPGDTVLVADGTYTGAGNRDIDFGGKNLVLQSENGPEVTIIDCEASISDQHRAISLIDISSEAVINGFTFQNGFIEEMGDDEEGAAISCWNASVLIENCIFMNNELKDGFGGALKASFSDISLRNVIFENNIAHVGGAIAIGKSNLQLDECSFLGNMATSFFMVNEDGIIKSDGIGGAIFCSEGNLNINQSVFANNISLTHDNNTGLGSAIRAGGLTSVQISNSSFVGNRDVAFYIGQVASTIEIDNSIIAFNGFGDPIITDASISLTCCNIFGNSGGDWVGDIAGQEGINGNFSADPYFCHVPSGDFHIVDISPCAPANNSCGVLIGALGVNCTVYSGPVWYVSTAGDDIYGTGSSEYPFATIQAGIDAAVPDDTVLVAPGTYVENIDFLGKKISLISSAGFEETFIQPIDPNSTTITIGYYQSQLKGFTIENGGQAITVQGDGGIIENNRFRNNISGAVYPLAVLKAGSSTIRNNLFYNNGGISTIWIDSYSTIENNTIDNNERGIYMNDESIGAKQSTIRYNNVTNNKGFGIQFDYVNVDCNNSWNNGYDNNPGPNGISTNPYYCDRSEGNYYIAEISECLPANNSCGYLIGAFGSACSYAGPIWHVLVDGDDINGIGTEDEPFATIQKGVDMAQEGDTVMVHDGTYTGNGNRDIDFGGKNLILMSQNGQEVTIIDCGGSESESHRGFNFHSGESSLSKVIGFSITGGYGPNDGPNGYSVGGAIKCDQNSSPVFQNNIITGNSAGTLIDIFEFNLGGSIFIRESNATFINNQIINNQTIGIYCENADPAINDCLISGNNGNGIVSSSSTVTIANSQVSHNSAHAGGGIAINQQSTAIISGCQIIDNHVYESFPGEYGYNPGIGGGIYISQSNVDFENCTIANNSGDYSSTGGGIYISLNSFVELTNCIIANNITWSYGSIYLFPDVSSSVVLSCCDIFGNSNADWTGQIADQENINGNFSANPLFCDASNGDFQISSSSICAPDNNSCGTLIGALEASCQSNYICADINLDDTVDINDLIHLINYYFNGYLLPLSSYSSDINCDGHPGITDIVFLNSLLFHGGIADCCP